MYVGMETKKSAMISPVFYGIHDLSLPFLRVMQYEERGNDVGKERQAGKTWMFHTIITYYTRLLLLLLLLVLVPKKTIPQI